ncbi:hypothetical protein GWK47_041066 [Chionoecetes opilio]|uniref:Uncharacterized protein n=1 Tax=Chionoecetes opilio TaxID=41210 RepID=A0A8J4YBL1_CHIOP|nr:hypothetical protein GWK47_041066 [Chionoecetes opilio]
MASKEKESSKRKRVNLSIAEKLERIKKVESCFCRPGVSGSVDIPTISRSSSLMSLGSEPEDSRPGTQASDQVDVVIAGGCSISSQELQTIKDKMAALTNYYKLPPVIKSKNAPDTSSKVLGKTIKVYNFKAKCQKCFAGCLSGTTHWQPGLALQDQAKGAAISRTSRHGLKHPSGDDQPQRHHPLLKGIFWPGNKIYTGGNDQVVREVPHPLSITDHPATREMFQVFQPEFRVPSRRTLTRDIKGHGGGGKRGDKEHSQGPAHVATTADSWTAHKKSTGSTPLTCPEDGHPGDQGETSLPDQGHHGHQAGPGQPRLQHLRKVVLTTTDNGANYVAASATMAPGVGEAEEDATNPDVEEVINSPEDQEEQEREGLDIISVTMALAAAAAVQGLTQAAQASKMQASKSKVYLKI